MSIIPGPIPHPWGREAWGGSVGCGSSALWAGTKGSWSVRDRLVQPQSSRLLKRCQVWKCSRCWVSGKPPLVYFWIRHPSRILLNWDSHRSRSQPKACPKPPAEWVPWLSCTAKTWLEWKQRGAVLSGEDVWAAGLPQQQSVECSRGCYALLIKLIASLAWLRDQPVKCKYLKPNIFFLVLCG